MEGIVNLLKPPGISSHQAVAFLRRQLGLKRIGHAGTLDPGASGVLVLVAGKATSLSGYLMEQEKTYLAEMTLGISTTSQDGGGRTVDLVTDFAITPNRLGEVLASFQGEQEQIPPMASALKVEGKRLYQLERAGVTVPRKPRPIKIHSLSIRGIWAENEDNLAFGTRVLFEVVCSKGTYVRTLCHDMGVKLGCGAHMSFLIRTASSPFTVEDAFCLEEIEALTRAEDYRFLLPLEMGLPNWVRIVVSPLAEVRIRHGNFILPQDFLAVPAPVVIGEDVVLMSVEGQVLALAEIKKTDQLICQPFRVFRGE